MQNHRLHPDFVNFSEKAFETAKRAILSVDAKNSQNWKGFNKNYLGALPGSILSEDCKLYPVYGEPYGSPASSYRAPHLAFSVWVPKNEETSYVPQWSEGESVAESQDKLRISRRELEQMDYTSFRDTFADRIEQFLDTQVTHGVLLPSFIGKDTGFFQNVPTFQEHGETWLLDGHEEERMMRPKMTLKEKIYKERQAFNQKMVEEAMPKGATEKEAHDALVSFAKKHDYIIVRNFDAASCESYQIPHAIHIDEANGYDWSNELPAWIGNNTDMSLAEGVTTIDDMDGLYPGIYIDTEENRKTCAEALQKEPSRRMECPENGWNLSIVAKYYPEHPFSKHLEKEHRLDAFKKEGHRNHATWCR